MKLLKTIIKFPHTYIITLPVSECLLHSFSHISHPHIQMSERCHSVQMIELDTFKVHDSLKINPNLTK